MAWARSQQAAGGGKAFPAARTQLVQARQAPVIEQLLAADPEMFHAAAAAGVDQLRNRIVDRLLGQAGQVEGDQVGQLAQLQGTGAVVQAQGAGAVERRHAQRRVGAEGGGAAGHGLGQQGGGAGFAEQVQIVVAGRAIGADRHVDAGLP